ncbi:MAG TPA: hypothetical protein VI386_14490 [Candidatus Sulfotelmatobacter sp.]
MKRNLSAEWDSGQEEGTGILVAGDEQRDRGGPSNLGREKFYCVSHLAEAGRRTPEAEF